MSEASESDAEIQRILNESEPVDKEAPQLLQPPDKDVWYDSLAQPERALQRYAVDNSYTLITKRSLAKKKKKGFGVIEDQNTSSKSISVAANAPITVYNLKSVLLSV